MAQSSVTIQISPQSVPSTPSWFAEVAAFAQVLTHAGILRVIQEQVRFTRARFGHYDLIDFVVVLIGYAVSGESTLKAFYERLLPFAEPFMALFGRHDLPHRSTLSRFLAALDQSSVEALRTLFEDDLVARTPFASRSGLFDRTGKQWLVVDVDGTRQAARQRALPKLETHPGPHRRFDQVCAPGYMGRKRGEVVRTRTTLLQAHTHQFLGTFGEAGNGDYRGELLRALQVINRYAGKLATPPAQVLVRLDGLYGDAAPLTDVLNSGLGVIARCKDYALLDLEKVQLRLMHPPDATTTHPESGVTRALFDCLDVPLGICGPCVRLLIATHPTTSSSPPVGVEREGMVYELFVSSLPSPSFIASDVLDLYLHRGSFETVLADEDIEQDPDRWCSHTPHGQECWQILSQWVWNLRLELGQKLTSQALRTTAFAPAIEPPPTVRAEPERKDEQKPQVLYGPPQFARPSFTGGFPGSAFTPQSDGTLRCPANRPLYSQERRPERDGSIRVLYAARIAHCRSCSLRSQCQESSSSLKPRRVSAVLWPLSDIPSAPPAPSPPASPPLFPVLWRDWPRCQLRREWLKLIRSETVTFAWASTLATEQTTKNGEEVLTRATRAHYRLSWQERLARNASHTVTPTLTVTLHGLPATFVAFFGFALLPAA
jgi:hypothetical protein